MQKNLFTKSSMDRISSPEKLNDYIQVANPGVWMVLTAIILLLVGVGIWAFFGSVSTTATVKGLAQEGGIVCYINAASDVRFEQGMQAAISGDVGTVLGEVSEVSASPLSYAEASGGIDRDYAVYALGLADWNIQVRVSADAALTEGAIYSVAITTQALRPIDLVLNH